MLVAEGAVDLACEPELELFDMAALVPIVTEAGGCTANPARGEAAPSPPTARSTPKFLRYWGPFATRTPWAKARRASTRQPDRAKAGIIDA